MFFKDKRPGRNSNAAFNLLDTILTLCLTTLRSATSFKETSLIGRSLSIKLPQIPNFEGDYRRP